MEGVSRRDGTRQDAARAVKNYHRSLSRERQEQGKRLEARREKTDWGRGGVGRPRTGQILALCCQDPTRASKQEKAGTVEESVETRRENRLKKKVDLLGIA